MLQVLLSKSAEAVYYEVPMDSYVPVPVENMSHSIRQDVVRAVVERLRNNFV